MTTPNITPAIATALIAAGLLPASPKMADLLASHQLPTRLHFLTDAISRNTTQVTESARNKITGNVEFLPTDAVLENELKRVLDDFSTRWDAAYPDWLPLMDADRTALFNTFDKVRRASSTALDGADPHKALSGEVGLHGFFLATVLESINGILDSPAFASSSHKLFWRLTGATKNDLHDTPVERSGQVDAELIFCHLLRHGDWKEERLAVMEFKTPNTLDTNTGLAMDRSMRRGFSVEAGGHIDLGLHQLPTKGQDIVLQVSFVHPTFPSSTG